MMQTARTASPPPATWPGVGRIAATASTRTAITGKNHGRNAAANKKPAMLAQRFGSVATVTSASRLVAHVLEADCDRTAITDARSDDDSESQAGHRQRSRWRALTARPNRRTSVRRRGGESASDCTPQLDGSVPAALHERREIAAGQRGVREAV
jgi:hypothetical protein